MAEGLPTPEHVVLKTLQVGLRSRFIILLLRLFLRPWLARVMRGPIERLCRVQLMIASRPCGDTSGLAFRYRVIGRAPHAVPGWVAGDLLNPRGRAVLYIHGGAFVLPASPDQHGRLMTRLCFDLDADGFLVDYRLAPQNKFPAALDDCERAYRALLEQGYAPRHIVVAGESAGGTLVLGLLQRIRAAGLPMPACAVPISPAADVGRIHGIPARTSRQRHDPLLGLAAFAALGDAYVGEHDTADPLLSPLYADFTGFPPLYFIASNNEVLRDDSILLAMRARDAGVAVKVDIWPVLPHAFPVLENWLVEARAAREDIVAFMRRYLPPA
ncbi:MAG: alpha/beta hydrolase [Nevskiaceae bacterium]|nr:MAG: alpha/beta hydrolase [Nevskiaceae bacterium]TBR73693.1 MAG: alpha/beta hydrolase [Nevskiaceae bacterium]